MASHIANETFGNFESKLFSFQSILSSDNNDPAKKFSMTNFKKLTLHIFH